MKNILILNGPNLNLLGKREQSVYGTESMAELLEKLRNQFKNQCELTYAQSNVEGELINILHESDKQKLSGIVFNPGGYTHTSVALADAIAAIETTVIEVHISNLYAREEFRQRSLTAAHCGGVIMGFGPECYALAIKSLL